MKKRVASLLLSMGIISNLAVVPVALAVEEPEIEETLVEELQELQDFEDLEESEDLDLLTETEVEEESETEEETEAEAETEEELEVEAETEEELEVEVETEEELEVEVETEVETEVEKEEIFYEVTFSDVAVEDWFYPYVSAMAGKGFVDGMDDGTFLPYKLLTVAELSTMISNAFYGKNLEEALVREHSVWWMPYVEATLERGGFEGTVVGTAVRNAGGDWGEIPTASANRYETAVMIYNLMMERGVAVISQEEMTVALATLSDVIPEGYQKAVAHVYHYGFMEGREDGSFDGTATLSRAEATTVLSALVETDLFVMEQASEDIEAAFVATEMGPVVEEGDFTFDYQVNLSYVEERANGQYIPKTYSSTTGVSFNGISVNNTGNHSITTADLAATTSVTLNPYETAPQILIYHSHTTEAFTPTYESPYIASDYYRTTDNNNNVTAVGAAMGKVFEAAGITVIHDTTFHDYPQYSGSYERSQVTVEQYLAQYPSIVMTIDVHRDAIESNGVPYQLVSEQGNVSAAQMMIFIGSETTTYTNPLWRSNLALANTLQSELLYQYGDLMRPIMVSSGRYNQHLLVGGAILLEVGGHGNTLQQAITSGELFAKATVDALT